MKTGRPEARSADPGQGVADEHVDDPGAAEGGAQHDDARGIGADLADRRRHRAPADGPGGRPARRRPRRGRRRRRTCPRWPRRAGRCPSSSHAAATAGRTGSAASSSTTVRSASRASSLQTVPTPPRVASRSQRVEGAAASRRSTRSWQRGGVGDDVGLEGQVAAGQHDRHPVIADGARGDAPRRPPRPGLRPARRPAGMSPTPAVVMYRPSAAPRSTTLVSPVTIGHAGGGRGLGHVGHDLAERVDRQSPPRARTRPTGPAAGRPSWPGR